MDPQLKSILTTIVGSVAAAVAASAATHGWINTSQTSAFTDILVTVAGALVTAGVGWYKARQNTQKAMIQNINAADNGVKVVSAEAPVQAVNVPLK
jgi:predicted phage tail protein